MAIFMLFIESFPQPSSCSTFLKSRLNNSEENVLIHTAWAGVLGKDRNNRVQDQNLNLTYKVIKLLNTLNIKHSELEKVRPNINKYLIKKSDLNLAKETYPISSIYILYSENDIKHNSKNLNMINIKKEQTKLFLLRENIFRPRIVKGLGKEAVYFSKLTKILKNCPISCLTLPRGILKMEKFLKNTFNKVAIENKE